MNNQYSDNEREKTYGLAEHIDTQLKQMSGDIKEVLELRNIFDNQPKISPGFDASLADTTFRSKLFKLCFQVIEHLNVVNCTNQDENNAMYQISKILNMHMDSLVWIDQNTGNSACAKLFKNKYFLKTLLHPCAN